MSLAPWLVALACALSTVVSMAYVVHLERELRTERNLEATWTKAETAWQDSSQEWEERAAVAEAMLRGVARIDELPVTAYNWEDEGG
jgi:hypothetical protein